MRVVGWNMGRAGISVPAISTVCHWPRFFMTLERPVIAVRDVLPTSRIALGAASSMWR